MPLSFPPLPPSHLKFSNGTKYMIHLKSARLRLNASRVRVCHIYVHYVCQVAPYGCVCVWVGICVCVCGFTLPTTTLSTIIFHTTKPTKLSSNHHTQPHNSHHHLTSPSPPILSLLRPLHHLNPPRYGIQGILAFSVYSLSFFLLSSWAKRACSLSNVAFSLRGRSCGAGGEVDNG